MPRSRRRLLLAIATVGALVLSTAPTGGTAGAVEPINLTAGNGIYTISMRNVGYPAMGTVGVSSGASNPYGNAIPLLRGGADGSLGSSYVTVRAYDDTFTGYRDYTQGERALPGGATNLDGWGTVERVGTTGLRVTHDYRLDFPRIIQLTETMNVVGSTFEDSTVVIELRLTNPGTTTERYGLRQALDLTIGGDDGPTFRMDGDPGFTTKATEYAAPPLATSWAYADNDVNPAPLQSFNVAGTSFSRPQLVQYACEQEAARFPFAYEIHAPVEVATPSDQCATTNGGDSTLLTTWGADRDHAIELAPGQSFTVTQTLMIKQVRPIVTTLTADPVVLQLKPFKVSNLTRMHARLVTAAGVPVVGRQVTFSTPYQTLCVAVTDANGDATCTGLLNVVAAILSFGVTTTFAGDATYAPAATRARLIQ